MKESTTGPKQRPAGPLPILLLAAILALGVAWGQYVLVAVPNRAYTTDWHARVIHGNSYYPDQYRILSFYLAHWLTLLQLPLLMAMAVVRFLFTFLSLAVLGQYLKAWVQPLTALLGVFMAAFALAFAGLFYSPQLTDPLNMFVFVMAFQVLNQSRDFWLAPLLVIGMLNRETAILLPLIYLAVRHGERPWKVVWPYFGFLSLLALGIYLGLRVVLGIRPPYASTSPLHYWEANLFHLDAWGQILVFFNISFLFMFRGYRSLPRFLQRAAWVVPLFLLIHYSVGYMREVRYFMALFPLYLPIVLINMEKKFI